MVLVVWVLRGELGVVNGVGGFEESAAFCGVWARAFLHIWASSKIRL